MKNKAIYTFVLFLGIATVSNAKVSLTKSNLVLTENPAKTVFVKDPKAADVNTFFSSKTNFVFSIYKPGTNAEFIAILDKLRAADGVENCISGKVTGDYYAITLILKSAKDKAWFAKAFKDAGIGHIKINNNEVIEVEKL